MIADKTFQVLRNASVRDRRLGMALLGSALVHLLTLLCFANYSVHGRAFTRPIFPPLNVRIEKPQAPESPAARPLAVERKKAALHLKTSMATSAVRAEPAEVAAALPEPGVSLVETAYLKPIGSRVNSPLLAGGEFLRAAQLSEPASMAKMRVPGYPREAREKNLSGWVTVMFFVDDRGRVVETAAVDASESFDSFATDVAAQMRDSTFAPGKVDGHAVKALAFTTVRFYAGAAQAGSDALPAGVR